MLTWTDEWKCRCTGNTNNPSYLCRLISIPMSEQRVTLVGPYPTISEQTNPPVWLIDHAHDPLILRLVSNAGQVCVFVPAVTLSGCPVHRSLYWDEHLNKLKVKCIFTYFNNNQLIQITKMMTYYMFTNDLFVQHPTLTCYSDSYMLKISLMEKSLIQIWVCCWSAVKCSYIFM